MKTLGDYRSNWSGGDRTPNVSSRGWNLLAIPAAVLLVMAILQAVSFSAFKDFLDTINIGAPAVVAVAIIIAEVFGALSLLRIPMNPTLRFFGLSLAVLVTGFWFIENLFLLTSNLPANGTSGFFGKFLAQAPSWWTAVEVSILLFWVVYAAELLKWRPTARRA